MHWWHVPGYVGMAIDAGTQVSHDYGKGYSFRQEYDRAGVVAIEGQGIDALAATIAGIDLLAGVETGPVDVLIAIGIFGAASYLSSNLMDQFNEKYIFPYLKAK